MLSEHTRRQTEGALPTRILPRSRTPAEFYPSRREPAPRASRAQRTDAQAGKRIRHAFFSIADAARPRPPLRARRCACTRAEEEERAIVRRENDERILLHTRIAQCLQHAADGGVEFLHDIAVKPALRFPAKLRRRKNRRMRHDAWVGIPADARGTTFQMPPSRNPAIDKALQG